jgi:cysteine synthase B
MTLQYPTIADCVGNTPLVRLQRLPGTTSNTLLLKLEGNNPAGSVKDRPALSMITRAELRGQIHAGDTLIEATSGNTGIALAMAAAIKGYKMILIMPDNSSAERKAAMTAYGAELILVSQEEGMEGARDLASAWRPKAVARCWISSPTATTRSALHHHRPGNLASDPGHHHPFRQLHGHHRHHHGRLALLERAERERADHRPAADGRLGHSRHPSLAPEYLPKIYQADRVDRIVDMAQSEAEDVTRRLAREEGIFCGVSSGGAVAAMLRLSKEVENAVIVAIICDRGDRYLSTGIFDAPN